MNNPATPSKVDDGALRVWCFGCIGGPGHYSRDHTGRIDWRWTPPHPWHRQIDGGLCGGDKYAPPDGKTYEHHKDGWTAVAFWDRSGDSRPASNTVFLVRADATTDQVLIAAREQWPQLFSRPGFPLASANQPKVPTLAVQLPGGGSTREDEPSTQSAE